MKFEDRLQSMDHGCFRAAMIFLRVFELRLVDMSVYLRNVVCWRFVGINVGVRHSPSTFREVQQHFERVDQLHSIINTCINSSNKHSYMYRVLSGSSQFSKW